MERAIKIVESKIKELDEFTKSVAPEKEIWAARNMIHVLKTIKQDIETIITIDEKNKMEDEMRQE